MNSLTDFGMTLLLFEGMFTPTLDACLHLNIPVHAVGWIVCMYVRAIIS